MIDERVMRNEVRAERNYQFQRLIPNWMVEFAANCLLKSVSKNANCAT
jgi:hypothetical protein